MLEAEVGELQSMLNAEQLRVIHAGMVHNMSTTVILLIFLDISIKGSPKIISTSNADLFVNAVRLRDLEVVTSRCSMMICAATCDPHRWFIQSSTHAARRPRTDTYYQPTP